MSLPRVRPRSVPAPEAEALRERVVLVTGATGGLGSAVVHAAAAHGATVILAGHHVRKLEKLYDALVATGGPEPVILPVDLVGATPTDFADLAVHIQEQFGRLDGLVHAAARFEGLTPLHHHAPDEWLRTLQVNLSAPFALTQACHGLLNASADSAVVFVTDDPDTVGTAHWGAYGVSKGGIERLASILHDENDTGPLRVHVLLPGPMRTQLRRRAWIGEDARQVPTPEAAAQAVVALLSPAGREWRGKMLDVRPDQAV